MRIAVNGPIAPVARASCSPRAASRAAVSTSPAKAAAHEACRSVSGSPDPSASADARASRRNVASRSPAANAVKP